MFRKHKKIIRNPKGYIIYLFGMLFLSIGIFGQQINIGKDIQYLESSKLRQEIIIQKLVKQGFKRIIQKPNGQYSQLVGQDESGRPLYYTTSNSETATITNADKLYNKNGTFTGSEMTIGMWDSGKPRTSHELLGNTRINYINNQDQTILRHPTHISGTLIGNSQTNTTVKGVAYQAKIEAYDWINDVPEMVIFANKGGIIANNSYGYDPIYYQTYQFGKYNQTAKDYDNIMYNYPNFQIVKSVGNYRNYDQRIVPQVAEKQGYDLLEGAGIAKNVLVIGSVNSLKQISNFSNFGPTDDGRIKPDFVSKGENVISSIETTNKSYAAYNGTSSAAASVSGGITLLQQYAKPKNDDVFLKSATIRALLVHTVQDIDSEGPDYKTGWGIPDFNKATEIIDNRKISTFIKEDKSLENGKINKISIFAKANEDLTLTLAWTDPAGNLDSQENLLKQDLTNPHIINDLDLRIERLNQDGTSKTYYPWKLQGMQNRNSNAIKGVNNVDNIEKIEIPKSEIPENGGIFTLIISHKNQIKSHNSQQDYSLVFSGVSYCSEDVILKKNQDNISVSSTVVKAKNITAYNNIKKGALNTNYFASNEINLIPSDSDGFTVENGAELSAEIVLCGQTMQEKEGSQIQVLSASLTENSTKPEPQNLTKINKLNVVKIAPNPTNNDSVKLEFTLENSSNLNYKIYDLSGNLLISEQGFIEFPKGKNKKEINLKELSAGIYFLKIQTIEGEKTLEIIKN